MRKIKISKIDIGGETQSRVAINQEAVTDYADALTAGESLPPVVVFHDGATYWLADGFHRYHAHRNIGALEIEADVRDGTLMDALLFAYGANKSHGLRRTNADKRNAVEGMLKNFGSWSDNRIAKHVGVAHTFVATIRDPKVAATRQENRDKSAAKKASGVEPGSTLDGCRVEPGSTVSPSVESGSTQGDEFGSADDFGPSPEELAFLEEKTKADQDAYDALVEAAESDDKLGEAIKTVAKQADEIARLKAQVRVLDERINGLMNEKNEAIRLCKSWQRKFEKLEKAAA